jgi:hypothetical protein
MGEAAATGKHFQNFPNNNAVGEKSKKVHVLPQLQGRNIAMGRLHQQPAAQRSIGIMPPAKAEERYCAMLDEPAIAI